MENPNIPTVKRLCHVFRALGMSDLRLYSPLGIKEVVYFLHNETHFEAPVNGFYAFENREWMNANLREYMRTELRVRKLKGRIERASIRSDKPCRGAGPSGSFLPTHSGSVHRSQQLRGTPSPPLATVVVDLHDSQGARAAALPPVGRWRREGPALRGSRA